MGLSEQPSRGSHGRKQLEYTHSEMGNDTIKEDIAPICKSGTGVLSEQVETTSYQSAGFKSGLGGNSSFKDRQSDPHLGGRLLQHYRQSSSQSRFNSKMISRPHYDSRKRDNSATNIGEREKHGSLHKPKEIVFN